MRLVFRFSYSYCPYKMDFRYYLTAAILVVVVCAQKPLVDIKNGRVMGAKHTTQSNTRFYGFHGIPYAKPPVNELRFMSPQTPDPWTGVLNATVDRFFCVGWMYSWNSANEDEDCLYLNVYTPDLAPSEALPVMLWLFPGAFMFGNASFTWGGPHYIMEHQNVIFVSVAYRLGPFGFLSTNDSSIPGNAGWKDMVMAVEWVYDNIAAFGGDPEKITLFGCSAGSLSVGLLTMNERVKGKFRATIEMSGSSLSIWSVNNDPTFFLKQYLANLNQSELINDSEKVKSFLQSLTVNELMAAYPATDPMTTPYPVIEQESDDAFFTHYHFEQIQSGNYTKVPAIVGISSGEFLFFLQDLASATAYAKTFDDDPTNLVPSNLKTNKKNYDAVISDIRSLYLKNNETWSDNLVAFGNYWSDHYFRKAVFKFADLRSKFSEVYLYVFDYHGGRVITPAYVEGGPKVSHGGDMPYITYMYPFISSSKRDMRIQRRMTTMLTNFANYLNPTPEKDGFLQNVTWTQYSADNRQFLHITKNLKIQTNFNQDVYDGWFKVYKTYADEIYTY